MTALLGRSDLTKNSIQTRRSQTSLLELGWLSLFLLGSGLLALLMVLLGPSESLLAWLVVLIGVGAVLYHPRNGLYLMAGFGLVGDTVLSPWLPFVKNFSSRESILYLGDAIIINPLEAFLGLTFLSWFIHSFSSRDFGFHRGSLFWPVVVFLGFVTAGLWYGLNNGGDSNIALWEARPIFYLAAMMILVTNLIKTRQQVSLLLWFVMAAIFVEGIQGNWYFWVNLRGRLDGVNAITEHSAAIHMNSLFVFFLAAMLYKTSQSRRIVLGLFSLIVLVPYFATQRRAAFLTLGLALILLAVMLYKENKNVFWTVVPPALAAILMFTAAFWNNSGPVGRPVQALRSVIAPGYAEARDQGSDAYRDLENINLHFTIQQKPLTGVGFGNKFYIVTPMPDISFFQWWQYFPHNSIIWIWLKTGIIGFISMLFLVGKAISLGGKRLRTVQGNDLRAAAAAASLYLIMHFTFAYADISWDNQSMLYVGLMMGLLNGMDRLVVKQDLRQQTGTNGT
jgi:hypothetical protein